MADGQPDDYLADAVEYTDTDGKRRVSRFTPICDFCCGEPDKHPIEWSYPAGEMAVVVSGAIDRSDDPWGACKDCHFLIERDSWRLLAKRSAAVQLKRFAGTEWRALSREQQEALTVPLEAQFALFRAARTGPPTRDFDPHTGEQNG